MKILPQIVGNVRITIETYSSSENFVCLQITQSLYIHKYTQIFSNELLKSRYTLDLQHTVCQLDCLFCTAHMYVPYENCFILNQIRITKINKVSTIYINIVLFVTVSYLKANFLKSVCENILTSFKIIIRNFSQKKSCDH